MTNRIFFWSPKENSYPSKACFCQWYPSPFRLNGILYHTAEHFMMACKAKLFGDEESMWKIIEEPEPRIVKEYGREVKFFDAKLWERYRVEIVTVGNYLKFTENDELCDFLLSTGDLEIVEASPYDRIWGIGLSADDPLANHPEKWRGLNLLGKCIMSASELIRNEERIYISPIFIPTP